MYQKIATYLDEISENPLKSCEFLRSHDINSVVLRYLWSGKNICDTTDAGLSKLKESLDTNDLRTICVATNIGVKPPAHEVFSEHEKANRAFTIASFFGAKFIKIGLGSKSEYDCKKPTLDWMEFISSNAIKFNIVPLFEITDDSHYASHLDLLEFLNSNKRWRILFDSAQFVLKRKVDPFVKYWVLLRNYCSAIDVRDLKIGHGYKPVGFGDTRILDTIRDAIEDGKWLFLEPSLGRRYGNANSKQESFMLAYNAFKSNLI